MTWTTIVIIVAGILVKFISSPPSALVSWFLSKFAIHPKLNSNEVTITYSGKTLETEEKTRFIDHFNEAVFLERNHIYPGDEEKFLYPETSLMPFVIHVKRKKKDMTFFVYCEDESIFVVKQKKKKVISYSLRSDKLHSFNVPNM
ncbi:MAG TPA: YfmQ family protein [Ureibacillus sp.]|nr:YfmQ family protein [Ureibacillus sp.]